MLQDQGLPLKAGASAICIWRSWGKGLVGTSGEKLCVCVGVFVCMCVVLRGKGLDLTAEASK